VEVETTTTLKRVLSFSNAFGELKIQDLEPKQRGVIADLKSCTL